MVTPDQISWAKYGGFEGPFFKGVARYSLPTNPTEADKRLRVLTATEGGTYDAINMYDRCIVSIGLIQWCEATYFLTSKLLHHVAETVGSMVVTNALEPALTAYNASFKKNPQGQWRFFIGDGREVTNNAMMSDLFLGCSGKEGVWTDEARTRAKLWASCLANVFADEPAQRAQADYTATRLVSFATSDARAILFDGVPDDGWAGAVRAAYLSFAGNLPAVASQQLKIAVARLKAPKWSPEWCTGVLQQLTFGPNIAIYPQRYNAIRPWLEKLWNVTLPVNAASLKAWQPTAVAPVVPVPAPVVPDPSVVPVPAPAPVVIKPPTPQPAPTPVPAPAPTVLPEVVVTPKPSFFTYLMNFVSLILSLIKRAKQ